MSYFDRVKNLDHARVSQCSELLQRVSGEREGGSIRGDIEGEDAAVGTVFLKPWID